MASGLLSLVPLKLEVFEEETIRNEARDRLHCPRGRAQLLSMDRMNRKGVGGQAWFPSGRIPITLFGLFNGNRHVTHGKACHGHHCSF